MRRGLIAWSKAELPEALFEQRVARAQAEMHREGLDALAIYTNHTRPTGAAWFTGFTPYWSEGLLVVPKVGRPQLAVALSKRVQDWIERVSCVGEVISGPRFGLEAGRAIAEETPAARIGVLELDDFPSGTAEELQSADPKSQLIDATALVDRLRMPSDAAEIALATRAARIAQHALAAIPDAVATDAVAIGAVEGDARRNGAEEVYVAVAADLFNDERFVRAQGEAVALGSAFALRLTVAYKGQWVRMTRTIARGGAQAGAVNDAVEELAAAAATLPDTGGFANASAWLVEGTSRSQPLEPFAGTAVAGPGRAFEGALVSLSMTLVIGGVPIPVAAPALAGMHGRAGALLVAPLFP
jgi:Xaa-Pro aminopeptidase